ncbi:serine hydrolase [Lactococcus hodotermopsidis]|uniref:Serine hydrolase n=1 Tax=Pseudolactococcus hodotermopsidis TaxID=2709157 RepID=A0A6A0BCR1_9LACT|nr:serine hydrolase [Lactococcus hodotermopsidis]GFH42636.1 serine hydrolase [Lactococcus hodotermopsidis]
MQEMIVDKKIKILQWLVFVAMLTPAFFTFPEKTEVVSSQTHVKPIPNNKVEIDAWSEIPKRAVALTELQVYSDENLSKKTGKISSKTKLTISEVSAKNFKLSDGTFIKNDKNQVVSDIILSTEQKKQTIYLTKDVEVLYTPLTTYDNQVYSRLTNGQKYQADKVAKTNWGTYYEVTFEGGKTGWIVSTSATLKNPKLDKVQTLLTQKYNNASYSIYVKQLDSEFTVGINQMQMMYSASLSKLPILYWTQKQINEGNASLDDQLRYDEFVNSWLGAFKTTGTGFLPKTADNKPYSLLDLINRTAKDSDNVSSNIIAYYETGQFSPAYQAEITKIAGQKWDPIERNASSEMTGRVLEALYQVGGAGFNSLIGTDYDDERIPEKLPKNIKVAHKIGTADEFSHDAAIIFASEPYILVIETSNASDNDVLANISKDIYEVMK